MINRYCFLMFILVLGLACNTSKPKGQTSEYLATYNGGVVTTQDIDQAILALSPNQRWVDPAERLAWYQRLTEDLVVSNLVINEAKQDQNLNEPLFGQLAHEAARELLVADYLRRNLPAPIPPTEAEYKELFTQAYGDGIRPARAMVSHIYKRLSPEKNKAALEQELVALRQRVLDGENFGQLAARYSDSESRHRQGRLGHLVKKELPADLANVIFSLEENQPSEPVFTKDGGHVFLAETIIPGKTFTLEEVKPTLSQKHFDSWLLEQIETLAASFEQAPTVTIPTFEEFNVLLSQPTQNAQLMTVGTFDITLQGFFEYVRVHLNKPPGQEGWDKNHLYSDFKSLVFKEQIYQMLKPQDALIDQSFQASFEVKRNKLWSEQLIRKNLLLDIMKDSESLRAYYNNQKARFLLPPEVKLEILTIPNHANVAQTMATLERKQQALNTNQISLAQLATQLGGETHTTDFLSSIEIATKYPQLMAFAFNTPQGQHSPPFRRQAGLSIFKVLEAKPPQEQPFSKIRRAVASDYLHNRGQFLYQDYAKKLLETNQFEFNEQLASTHGLLGAFDTEKP